MPQSARSTEPTLRIRAATLADAPALAELAARTFAEAYAGDIAAADIADYVADHFSADRQHAELADARSTVLLAEEGGALVGHAWLCHHAHADCRVGPDAAELARIYVARHASGRGIGAALLTSARDEARRRGARTLWLSVWERNVRAIAFYERHGFAIVGEQPFRVGAELQRDHLMARSV